MDTLAIPSPTETVKPPSAGQLRAVRSVGSLRTPHSSQDAVHQHGGQAVSQRLHSLSPPDLSFSKSTLLSSDQEGEFMSRGVGSTSSSNGILAGDSWNSRKSGYSSGKNRVRLDSVSGNSLPGFPYINSAAAATSAGLSHDLRIRASWSDRGSASRSGRSHSALAREPSGASHTSGEADTSCSGGSNSSDEVDLDLSWDLDVLRARQHAQQLRAAQANPQKGKAAHVGIDVRSSMDLSRAEEGESGDSGLPSFEDDLSPEQRRYRLAGKKRMSKSAAELRKDAVSGRGYSRQQQTHSWTHNLAIPVPGEGQDGDLGWSFATTPPLSPAELVTFVEQSQRNTSILSHTAESARASKLLRKRRPSFPLMHLIDKAMGLGHTAPSNSPGSDSSSSSWGSPTPTQSDPSAVPERHDTMLSSTTSPLTSDWSSPQSRDEIPTPRTGEFDNRFSQLSASVAASEGQEDTLRHHPVVNVVQAETKGKERAEQAEVAARPGHTRQSSSIFRFPFTSLLGTFAGTRPGTATTVTVVNTPIATPTIAEIGAPLSPTGSNEQLASEENHSQESHSQGSHETAQSSSPPKLGATSRARISDSMMRPGPNVGKGRLTGLGLHLPGPRHRQSSLPVLSFSSPSEDSHGHGDHHSDEAIQVIEDHPAMPSAAPPTTVHFARPAASDLLARSASDRARTQVTEQAIQVQQVSPKRPRHALPRPNGLDLRGRLEDARPSQLLFFAAFILGPWCFVVGGWCLRSLDGECPSYKGSRCRCPPTQDSCECHAEIYRQVRLMGGKREVQANGELQTRRMDRYVLANRIAALVSGSASLVLAITALIVVGRTW